MPFMYAKIFTSLWDGSLRGRSDEILVFINLLTHANPAGEVDRHFKAIADETGLPTERVRAAITALESDDPESRSPVEKGKRVTRLDDHRDWGWKIINYDHYRGLVSDHERREKTKERTRKWREKKELGNGDAIVTLGDACDAKQKQKEKKKDIKNKEVVVEVPEVLKTREFVCQWEIWMNYRRAFAKPLNWAIFFQEQLDWLTQFGPKTAAEILKTSIRNGWQGLFAPKNTPKQEKTLKDKLFEEMNNKDAYI